MLNFDTRDFAKPTSRMTATQKINPTTIKTWLPAFPQIAAQVLDIFSNDEFTMVQLVNTIKTDPSLTANILKVANSPLYRTRSEIATLEHAVSWLGKKEIAGLALSFSLADFTNKDERTKQYFASYWCQSFIQAVAMDALGVICSDFGRSEAYIAGILMDIGRLMLLNCHTDTYVQLLDAANETTAELVAAEIEQFGADHGTIGSQILNAMGLPKRFAEVSQFHTLANVRGMELESVDNAKLVIAGIVSSAVGDFYCGRNQGWALSRIESLTVEHFGFGNADLQWFLERIRKNIEQKANLFQINLADVPSNSTLVGRAAEYLAVIRCGLERSANQRGHDGTEIARLQKENQRLRTAVKELEIKVCLDPLTHVYNREYLSGRFEQRVSNCYCSGEPMGMLMIDIDNFKQINDEQGHLIGDKAICLAASIIRDVVKEKATIARFGGDEFIVLFEEATWNDVNDMARTICCEVVNQSIKMPNIGRQLSASVGGVFGYIDRIVAGLDGTLFAEADKAMYECKRRGGNAFVIRELAPKPATVSSISPLDDVTENVRLPGSAYGDLPDQVQPIR